MMQNESALPMTPELWHRLPRVRPFGRYRVVGVVAVVALALVTMAVLTGLATPRFRLNGSGGGSAQVTATTTDGLLVHQEYQAISAKNVSLRPWTITGVRVGGDATVASRLSADPSLAPGDPPLTPMKPYRVGVDDHFLLEVTLPDWSGPCVNGAITRPAERIEVRVTGLFGTRWVGIGHADRVSWPCP